MVASSKNNISKIKEPLNQIAFISLDKGQSVIIKNNK